MSRTGGRTLSLAAIAVVALAMGGCTAAPVQPVRLDLAGAAADANYDNLAFVLAKATNDQGYVDYDDLKKHAARLEAQLKRLAVCGPMATPALYPSPGARLAYWYNARTAWAIKLAFDANCPRDSLAPSRLEERPFPLDGRPMTLDALDAIILRDHGWQAAVGAPCIRLHRSRLPARPFSPLDVEAVVPRRFLEYLGDRDRFVIDVERRTIFYPPVLWSVRGRLIEEHGRTYRTEGATLNTAFLPFVRGVAALRLQDATGYAEAEGSRDGPLACLRH